MVHRILHTRKNKETLFELTEYKALSGVFNVELPPDTSYEEMLKLLSSENLV